MRVLMMFGLGFLLVGCGMGQAEGGDPGESSHRSLAETCEPLLVELRNEASERDAELATLRQELVQLRQTPDFRIEAAAQLLISVMSSDSLGRQRTVVRELEALLERYPEASAVGPARRTTNAARLRIDIAGALAIQDYSAARRALTSREGRAMDRETREQFRRAIFEQENAPQVTSVRELKNSGTRLIGQRVRVTGTFSGLDQGWVRNLPGVRGQWSSPEGLQYSFSRTAANRWLGFMMSADGELFQRAFALRDPFESQLMAMRSHASLTVTGRVVDFGTNNWVALIVDRIDSGNTTTTAISHSTPTDIDSETTRAPSSSLCGSGEADSAVVRRIPNWEQWVCAAEGLFRGLCGFVLVKVDLRELSGGHSSA